MYVVICNRCGDLIPRVEVAVLLKSVDFSEDDPDRRHGVAHLCIPCNHDFKDWLAAPIPAGGEWPGGGEPGMVGGTGSEKGRGE